MDWGMTQQQADAEIAKLHRLYTVFPNSPEILPEWERLVQVHGSVGKQNHDAHIVAAMACHGISMILTLNPGDFLRYSQIQAIDTSRSTRDGVTPN